MPSSDDIAWAVGLFEGEGCMTTSARARDEIQRPSLSLKMTDEDTVRRFYAIVDAGTVYEPNRARLAELGRKPIWQWQVGSKVHCERILTLFYPRLSLRRKRRADEVLAICRAGARRTADHRLVSFDGTPVKYNRKQKEASCLV